MIKHNTCTRMYNACTVQTLISTLSATLSVISVCSRIPDAPESEVRIHFAYKSCLLDCGEAPGTMPHAAFGTTPCTSGGMQSAAWSHAVCTIPRQEKASLVSLHHTCVLNLSAAMCNTAYLRYLADLICSSPLIVSQQSSILPLGLSEMLLEWTRSLSNA